MRAKRLTAVLLTGALAAASLTGCGINKNATVASMKEQEVSLGLANFICRFQQASYEDMYKGLLGGSSEKSIWEQDLYGNGTTMGDNMKDSVMEELHEMYTLQAHMRDYKVSLSEDEKKAIDEAAAEFLKDNSKETIKEMGADQEIITEFLTLYTIKDKMTKAIEAEADTTVTDEEANMRGYSMVKISLTGTTDEDGNQVEYTDDEKNQVIEKAQKMASDLKAEGADLAKVAEANGFAVETGTYAKDDSSLDADVKTAMDGLKEGETSGLIKTDSTYYFVRIDTDTDKDATEQNRQSLIETKKSDHYNDVLSGWQEKDGWKVNDKKLAQISFKNSLTGQDPDAATEASESVQSTQ